ncbi:MAG TPA: hypothetical protein VFR38_05385 [Gaiellaceae bacterium]|nr:hypothetical protein [Gaiellaceae bacterium]
MLVRILIWDVFESKTTLDELRDTLPELEPPSRWIWNEAAERFGIISFGDDLPEAVGWAQDLIGGESHVYEEFDSGGS